MSVDRLKILLGRSSGIYGFFFEKMVEESLAIIEGFDPSVRQGVQSPQSIAPCASTISSLDHEMTKCSITPSIILQCKAPDSVSESFVRGRVVTVVNNSIFPASTPFIHASRLAKIMCNNDAKILMKMTDGGVDNGKNARIRQVCISMSSLRTDRTCSEYSEKQICQIVVV